MNCKQEFNKDTSFVRALLHEVTALLADLIATGTEGSIDLRGIPMLDEDKKQLETALGRGEVEAKVVVAGETEVWETAYSGVWWIRHRGAGDRILSDQIVVTTIPEILKTHPSDAEAAHERLHSIIESERLKEGEGESS
jgi:hydrogenase-1 operon protein HyaF